MRSNEVLPVCVLAAPRCGSQAMTAKNVAYRLIRNNVTEVGQRSDNSIVTPAWVLSRHLNYQLHNLVLNWRPARIRALSGTVELLGNQPAVPPKYCVRFGDAGDLFQSFTAQSLANFGERESLRIRQSQPSRQMRSQDAVLRSQVLVLQQQLLVYESSYICQQPRPLVVLHANCPSSQVLQSQALRIF